MSARTRRNIGLTALALWLAGVFSFAQAWGKRAHGHLAFAAWQQWTNPAKNLLDFDVIREAAETTDGHPDYPPQDHVFYPEARYGFTGGADDAAQRALESARSAAASGDYKSASEHLGRLAHIVSDVSQPFHTTPDGATSKNDGHNQMDSHSNGFFDGNPPSSAGPIQATSASDLVHQVAQTAISFFPVADRSPTDPGVLTQAGGLGVSAILSAWDLAFPPSSPVAQTPPAAHPAKSEVAQAPPATKTKPVKPVATMSPEPIQSRTPGIVRAKLREDGGRNVFYAYFDVKPRLQPTPISAVKAALSEERTGGDNHRQPVSIGGISLVPGRAYRLRLITSPVGHQLLEVTAE